MEQEIQIPIENKSKSKWVPSLRFKEFVDGWEKKKLGDVGKIRMCKRIFSSDTTEFGDIPFYKIGTFGKQADAYITNELYLDYRERFSFPKIGDILMSASGTLGRTVIYDGSPSYYQDSNIVWIDNEEDVITNSFLFYIYQIVKYDSEGGTIQRLYNNIINNAKFSKPSLPEQQKIANFLSAVDNKIQQLTQKKEILETYKKGVMQQLFSQKLRFKDDNGKDFPEWEEKRLDAMISNFIVPMRDKPKVLEGEIPWCRIEDFDGKYLSKSKSSQGVSLETVKDMNLKIYPVGTLLVSCSANLGFCAITERELITNQTFIGLVPDKKMVDVLYLLYVMRMLSRELNILSSGTTISYLSRQQFEKFKVPYPSFEEQKIIANFLSRIDNKIEAVSQQITKTQIFKKGLLQQMFV